MTIEQVKEIIEKNIPLHIDFIEDCNYFYAVYFQEQKKKSSGWLFDAKSRSDKELEESIIKRCNDIRMFCIELLGGIENII